MTVGGIGMYVDIEPADPPAGKKRSSPRALHTAISRAVLDRIWNACRFGAFRHTAGEYLAQERSDGRVDGLWSATPTELSWSFMDHAGCCNGSMRACYHWFEVCLHGYRDRWEEMAASRGWRITTPVRSALFGTKTPLVAHGGQPLCIPRFAPGKLDWEDDWGGPYWDDGSPRPRLADFDDRTRSTVVHAAITGRCTCGVCWQLQPWDGTSTSAVELLERAWLALPENADLAAEVRTAVAGYGPWRAEPSGPPALKRLSEKLADPLKPWELAGMCFQLV